MSEINKVFVFSSSYNIRLLLKILGLFSTAKSEIILLSEIGITTQREMTIHKYETLDECLKACTQVLIISDSNIPDSKINYVLETSKHIHKKCKLLQNDIRVTNNIEKVTLSKKDIPLVLIISYGLQNQLPYLECLLFKILLDNAINVLLTPSKQLQSVFKWIAFFGINIENNNYIDSNIDTNTQSVMIQSVQMDSINEINTTAFQLNPDIIVANVAKNYRYSEYLINVFRYRYCRKLDIIAHSEIVESFANSKNMQTVLDFSECYYNNKSEISLSDETAYERLSRLIIPKLILPKGVFIL